MNRPLSNGSSGTTIEVLFLLTLTGAGALSWLGLRTVSPRDERDPEDHVGRDEPRDRDPD